MLIQRLGSETQIDNKMNKRIIESILKNPGSCDEVWVSSYYGWPPLSKHSALAERLRGISEMYREAGIKVSLQISNTIGHGFYQSAEDCTGMINDTTQSGHMVGHDGTVAEYAFCWNDEVFRKYVLDEVALYVSASMPDTVWVDDDFRATNHSPVKVGCFCDGCIARFNKKHGSFFTRESLVEEYLYGDIKWRERYIDFVREGLSDLMLEISRKVHEISPESYMGLQFGNLGSVVKSDVDFLLDAMKMGTEKAPRIRPGGGAYDDRNPDDIIRKYCYIYGGRSLISDEYLEYIAPEIENLPDVAFGKSVAGTCLETSLYLAGGSNHMSYAAIQCMHEEMDFYETLFEGFSRCRPYWDRLVSANIDTYQAGIRAYVPRNAHLKKVSNTMDITDFRNDSFGHYMGLINTAIPFSYDRQEESVIYIDLETAPNLTAIDVEYLLDKPVLIDAKALEILIANIGLDIGITPIRVSSEDAFRLIEVFDKHPISGEKVGYMWQGSFYSSVMMGLSQYTLKSKCGAGEKFSSFTDSNDMLDFSSISDAAGVVVTTGKGAKWAVFGNNLQCSIISTAKRNQFIAAAEYVSGKPICARLVTPIPCMLLPRKNAKGLVVSVSLLNRTVGDSGKLSLEIVNPAGKAFSFMAQNSSEVQINSRCCGDDKFVLDIPNLSGWSVGTVFVK